MASRGKKIKSMQRKALKAKAKAARKALYEAEAVANKARKASTHRGRSIGRHSTGRCFNIGCRLCNPASYNDLDHRGVRLAPGQR